MICSPCINYPTLVVEKLSRQKGWVVLVVADAKTPKDWSANSSNVILLTIEEQMALDFDLVDIIPLNSYVRKNIGYLCAIKCGAEMIYEVDDDNVLLDGLKLNEKSRTP